MANSKMADDMIAPRMAKVTVQFDQQQRRLLDFLRSEGTFGREDGEIIRNVVLDYLKQKGPAAGGKA